MSELDEHQRLYLEHKQRKRRQLGGEFVGLRTTTPRERRSIRRFKDRPIDRKVVSMLLDEAAGAPSSCNRQAVSVGVVYQGPDVWYLGDWLAGGTGWLEKAPLVMLFFANLGAYKGPREREWMPWLDCAASLSAVMSLAFLAGLGTCWVNPNVRAEYDNAFHARFNPSGLLFGSALAIGEPDESPPRPPRRTSIIYYGGPR